MLLETSSPSSSPRHLRHRLSIIREVSEESSASSTPHTSPKRYFKSSNSNISSKVTNSSNNFPSCSPIHHKFSSTHNRRSPSPTEDKYRSVFIEGNFTNLTMLNSSNYVPSSSTNFHTGSTSQSSRRSLMPSDEQYLTDKYRFIGFYMGLFIYFGQNTMGDKALLYLHCQ